MATKAKDSAFTLMFRRQAQRRMSILLVSIVLLNFILGLYLIYIIMYPEEPLYFSTSINNKTSPLDALHEPNLSDFAVLQWANQAAIAAFTYDFVNYSEQLFKASEFFTANGWDQFVTALKASGAVKRVEERKLVVSSVAIKPPIILQKGVVNGVYSWRIQMPLLITYRSASEVAPKQFFLTMLVVRVPATITYKGIGIEQFLVQAGSISG